MMIELATSQAGTKQAFNTRYIVKIAKRDKDGFTFMDLADYGNREAILAWTIYEPYEKVLKKFQEEQR